jgi:hypothetical protein
MDEEDEDQRQFFRDVSATVEQTVEEVRGFEENYYSLTQMPMLSLPGIGELSKRVQNYVEEYFANCSRFALELSQARNFQDFFRIQIEYSQNCLQSFAVQARDFAETYSNAASAWIKPPPIHPSQ